jgi:hypothetical protein
VPIVAIAVLLLVHAPPVVRLDSAVVAEAQTDAVPAIVPAVASGETVTILVA